MSVKIYNANSKMSITSSPHCLIYCYMLLEKSKLKLSNNAILPPNYFSAYLRISCWRPEPHVKQLLKFWFPFQKQSSIPDAAQQSASSPSSKGQGVAVDVGAGGVVVVVMAWVVVGGIGVYRQFTQSTAPVFS